MAIGRAEKEFLIQVRADITDALRQMREMNRELSDQGRQAGKQKREIAGLGDAYGNLKTAVAGYLTVSTALKNIRIADEYGRLQAQIERTTRAQGDYNQVSKQLFDISQANGVLLRDSVGLFRGINRAAAELGKSRDDVLAVTNAIQQLSIMGDAGPQQLAGAMLQLQQLFSGTVVQAQEFNSLIDATPDLVDAIARGMGKTRSELILAVKSGEILVKDVFLAIQREAPRVAQEMASVPENLTRGSNQLANSWARLLGEVNKFNPVGREGKTLTQEWSFFMGDMANRMAEINASSQAQVQESEEVLALRAKEAMLVSSIARLQKQALEFETERGRVNTFLVKAIEQQQEKLEAVRGTLNPQKEAPAEAAPPPDPDAENRQRRIKSLTNSLREMAATYGMSAEAVSLYRLQQEGASAADLAAARSAIAVITAKKDQEKAIREAEQAQRDAAQQAEDAADAAERENEQLDAQAQYWRDLINPANAYQRQLEEIEELYARGKLSAEIYQEATLQVMESFDRLGEKGEETADQLGEFMVQAARNIQNALGDGLFDIMQGNFDDIGTSFKTMLDRMVANALAAELGKAIFGDFDKTGTIGGFAGDLFGSDILSNIMAGVFHSGGIAGQGSSYRSLPALAAANAPRYHAGGIAGLRSNEMVSVLERGEEILQRTDPRHVLNGGGSKTMNATFVLPNVTDTATFRKHMPSLVREASRRFETELSKV